MHRWILLLPFLWTACFAETLNLKEKLSQAATCSYLVTEQNKVFTFLHIRDKSPNKLFIEEVSIPASRFLQFKVPFRIWFEKGAPGHTAWILSQIDIETGKIEKTYSFLHKSWVVLDSSAFFTQLINLPFQQIADVERKKVGASRGHPASDKRYVWNPPVICDGKVLQGVTFSVFRAQWPYDGSDFSNKWIEIYMPLSSPDENGMQLPNYFPYWVEIEGRLGNAKLRVVDSGLNAKSPKHIVTH